MPSIHVVIPSIIQNSLSHGLEAIDVKCIHVISQNEAIIYPIQSNAAYSPKENEKTQQQSDLE